MRSPPWSHASLPRPRPISPFAQLQRAYGLYPAGVHTAMSLPQTLGRFGSAVVGQTASGASMGASAGSLAGSVIPIAGNVIGAAIGAIVGGLVGVMNKKDPEDANFQQASAIYRSNPDAVLNIANKYLVLAGLFDLQPNQIKGNIPIYKKYGHMGEYRFVTDLAGVIQSAANTGRITASDTPMTVYNNVVMPWINSFGYGPMQDSNGDMISEIILGMTAEYIAGAQSRWYAVGGDYPFGSLPPFKLPVSTTAAGASAPTVANPAVTPLTTGSTLVTQSVGPAAYVSPSGTVITANNGVLYTPLGGGTIFQFAPNAGANGEYQIFANGQALSTGISALWDGTTVYLKHQSGAIDRWSGNGWVPNTPAPATSAPGTPTVSPIPTPIGLPVAGTPSVQVPVGYTPVSGASGTLPVYVDAQGAYWQLAGSTLSPYTGTLMVNGQLLPIQNGLLTQAAVTSVTTPTLANPSLYPNSVVAPTPYYPSAPTSAPPVSAPATMGLSGNTSLWIMGGLAVLAVIFATARPVGAPVRSTA